VDSCPSFVDDDDLCRPPSPAIHRRPPVIPRAVRRTDTLRSGQTAVIHTVHTTDDDDYLSTEMIPPHTPDRPAVDNPVLIRRQTAAFHPRDVARPSGMPD